MIKEMETVMEQRTLSDTERVEMLKQKIQMAK